MDGHLGRKAHNESTVLIVGILLHRGLKQTLSEVGAGTLGTNLVIHHGVTDILDQVAKLIHILGAVQELCDLASLCKWGEGLDNTIQFPGNACTSDISLTSECVGYRLRISLLSSSLTSPSGTGALSECGNPSTRGINDSFA